MSNNKYNTAGGTNEPMGQDQEKTVLELKKDFCLPFFRQNIKLFAHGGGITAACKSAEERSAAVRKCFLYKVLSIWLAFVTLLFSFPGQTWAMFVPCSVHEPVEISGDLQSIQRTLEASLVRQRLMDIGLTSEEAMERIQSLSDEQIHEFATRLDALQAGAGIVDVLVIAILAVVITVGVLELTGHSVIIR